MLKVILELHLQRFSDYIVWFSDYIARILALVFIGGGVFFLWKESVHSWTQVT